VTTAPSIRLLVEEVAWTADVPTAPDAELCATTTVPLRVTVEVAETGVVLLLPPPPPHPAVNNAMVVAAIRLIDPNDFNFMVPPSISKR